MGGGGELVPSYSGIGPPLSLLDTVRWQIAIGGLRMPIGLGDVVRVTAHMKLSGTGDIMNTFDLEVTTAGTGGNTAFKNTCRDWLDELYDTIGDKFSTSLSYDKVHFYQRNGLEVLTPISWSGLTAPADAGNDLPYGTSALVYARTSERHILPRKFIGGFTEDKNTAGHVDSALLPNLQDFAAFWLLPYSGAGGWDLQAVCWPGSNTGSIPLIEGVVSDQWAIQRRRRVGRGS